VRGLRPFAARPSCQCGGGGTNWSQQAELTASNGQSADTFGYTVALSGNGNIALIGAMDANNMAGAAYVFVRSGSSWIQAQELTAYDGAGGNMFGRSVALNSTGSTLLVGAPAKNGGKGAVYVFVSLPYWGWGLQAELTASDGNYYDYFGVSTAVSGDGNSALIGAYGKNVSRGAAYTFARSGNSWGQQAELTAPDGAANDEYGWSVALSSDGSTALIGAPWKYYYDGAAYVYGHGSTGWSQQAELTASNGATDDVFGSSVALNSNGTAALIGAPGKNYNSGAAYVFVPFFGWYQAAQLTASDGGRFGTSVALSGNGNTALIGGPTSNGDTGASYVFQGSWSSWTLAAELLASDGAMHDNSGTAVALSGDGNTALVGAYGHNNQTGAAYIF
jgi:hypothetical protein